jgi:hypothetical protein
MGHVYEKTTMNYSTVPPKELFPKKYSAKIILQKGFESSELLMAVNIIIRCVKRLELFEIKK